MDGRAIWHVHLLEAFPGADEVLSGLSEITLTRRARVSITSKQVENIAYTALWERAQRASASNRYCEIRCKTPCTQKSLGAYLMFPSLPLLFRTLHMRATDLFAGQYTESEESSMALGEAVRIKRYALASAPIFIKEVPIVGFTGSLQLILPDAVEQRRHTHVLLALAPFTGLGAKTALGMGGVEVSLESGESAFVHR